MEQGGRSLRCLYGRGIDQFRHERQKRRVSFGNRVAALLICSGALILAPSVAAQELEPRAYSPSPTGANFLVIGFGRSNGSIVFDPSIPLTDTDATIYSPVLGLGRTFGIFGRQALGTASLPYAFGHAEGKVGPQLEQQRITRSGLADVKLKLSVNLHGNPALKPAEFARVQHRTFLLGASVTIQSPTGQYDATKLINLGTNRWAFKPEVGVSYPLKNFYFDFYAGAWLFTQNNRFFPGATIRQQEPLPSLQAHVSYSFRTHMWLAVDGTWYHGGDSRLNDGPPSGRQNNSRVGATLSLPLGKYQSLKVAYSNGVSARIGSRFNTAAVFWQFLWF